MIGRNALAAWLAAASTAFAQVQSPAPNPGQGSIPAPRGPAPTAQQIAAAKATADQLIAKAKVGDVFEAVDGSAAPRVRHRASGMDCNFAGSNLPADALVIFPGRPRGDDVGCNTTVGHFLISLFATRVGAGAPVNQLLAQAVTAVQALHPDLKPFSGEVADMSHMQGVPPAVTKRFVFEDKGHTFYTRVSVAVIRDWMVEERETGVLDAVQTEHDAIGELVFTEAMTSVARAAPASQGTPIDLGQVKRPPPPTPAQIAAARAAGDALISQAAASDVFENISDGGSIRLRHKPSGRECGFDVGKPNAIKVQAGGARGDDVTCLAKIADFDEALHISRQADKPVIQDALKTMVTAFLAAHPDAKPYSGPTVRANGPAHVSAQFSFTGADGKVQYAYLGAAARNDWTLGIQVTGPAQPAGAGSLLGELTLLNNLIH